jgi:hypothetical protein
MRNRRARIILTICLLAPTLASWGLLSPRLAAAAPPEGFASAYIRAIWQRDDGAVAAGSISQPWMWGPGPFYTNYEPDADAPEGNHLVQYFDKGRLEVNDPNGDVRSPWFVTSGLLVAEMVAGSAGTGAKSFYRLGPANIPVAGDQGAPTYADFASHTGPSPGSDGQPVTALLRAGGATGSVDSPPAAVKLTSLEVTTGHYWADIFRRFATDAARPSQFDWLHTLGYPITDPYWLRVTIGGKPATVLAQLFERRVLTYNPSNPPATQVEMGNAGRHYFNWRYHNLHSAGLRTGYAVHMSVGPAPTRAVHVAESATIANTTGQVLHSAVLRAAWHNWDGVFTMRAASVGGAAAEFSWREGVNLVVNLAAPLSPGAKATIDLQFDLKPRPVGGRTGYDRSNDILSLGDVLPTVVPWENGGWAYYPYSDLGDLGYYETGDYSVTIDSTSGERLIVGGTGEISSVDAARTHWVFSAPNVRDAEYVVSPGFIDPLSDASMRRQVGSITVRAYFLPGHRAAGQRQLDLVSPALSWFGQQIGAYPFHAYTVAEMGVPLERTDDYAQEYPMSYSMPTNWLSLGTTPGSWTWYIPVHEVGHQWFYSAVGSNQLLDPWLDEAMTTYNTAEYVRANFPDLYPGAWQSMSGGASGARPVSSSVYSGFANENQYSVTVYDGGVRMLDRVRKAMGDGAFYEALRDYYAKYKLARATPFNLLDTLQAHSKADLQGIFSAYLSY